MQARVMLCAALAGAFSIGHSAYGVGAQILGQSEGSNLTGTTDGQYTPIGGGSPTFITGGTTQSYSATSATGGTSGGQVDGPAFAKAEFVASINSLRSGGALTITYEYHGLARFDTANYFGGVGSAFIGHIVFQIDQETPFHLGLVGDPGNDSIQFRALTGNINDGVLSPGIYEFLHNGGVFASSNAGSTPLDQVDVVVTLTLPSPGAAALGILAGAGALRRRRR